ncbi:TRANK1, partial [Symbiodinium necroappetens]
LELAVFFVVMKKPYEELFLTGDTSQTVSRAVEFRFCDLQSLFHHFNRSEKVPELDQLLINFRSHQKILALSHRGVVQPLELAFPHAIDKLAADTGHRDGVLPVIVKDVALEDARCTRKYS